MAQMESRDTGTALPDYLTRLVMPPAPTSSNLTFNLTQSGFNFTKLPPNPGPGLFTPPTLLVLTSPSSFGGPDLNWLCYKQNRKVLPCMSENRIAIIHASVTLKLNLSRNYSSMRFST